MEPIQVSFTSKYIDGAQTRISTTPGDTHAGATIGNTTHHFPTRPDTTITPFNFPPPIAHAEATTTIAQAQAMGCTHHKCFPPTPPQAATALLPRH